MVGGSEAAAAVAMACALFRRAKGIDIRVLDIKERLTATASQTNCNSLAALAVCVKPLSYLFLYAPKQWVEAEPQEGGHAHPHHHEQHNV